MKVIDGSVKALKGSVKACIPIVVASVSITEAENVRDIMVSRLPVR